MTRERQRHRNRYLALKASGKCVTCALVKAVKGRTRCHDCQHKMKVYDTLHRIKFYPSASALTNDELYRRAKSEREVVSWAWKFPA